jgi:hypothetical protein
MLDISKRNIPSDEIFYNFLYGIEDSEGNVIQAGMPDTKFFDKRFDVVPLSYKSMPFIITTDKTNRTINLKIQSLTPSLNLRNKKETSVYLLNTETVVLLNLNEGHNYIVIEDSITGETAYTIVNARRYATFLWSIAYDIYNNVKSKIIEQEAAIYNKYATRLVEPLLSKVYTLLPSIKSLQMVGIRLLTRTYTDKLMTDRGVIDTAQALTLNHAYFSDSDKKAIEFDPIRYPLETYQEFFSSKVAHLWIPNLNIIRWKTFMTYIENTKGFSVGNIDEKEIIVNDYTGTFASLEVQDLKFVAANTTGIGGELISIEYERDTTLTQELSFSLTGRAIKIIITNVTTAKQIKTLINQNTTLVKVYIIGKENNIQTSILQTNLSLNSVSTERHLFDFEADSGVFKDTRYSVDIVGRARSNAKIGFIAPSYTTDLLVNETEPLGNSRLSLDMGIPLDGGYAFDGEEFDREHDGYIGLSLIDRNEAAELYDKLGYDTSIYPTDFDTKKVFQHSYWNPLLLTTVVGYWSYGYGNYIPISWISIVNAPFWVMQGGYWTEGSALTPISDTLVYEWGFYIKGVDIDHTVVSIEANLVGDITFDKVTGTILRV